jgi:hypothetical protein
MILTHFGINNQTFTNGGAAGSSGTGAMAQEKTSLFFTMRGMNMRLYYQKKDKNLVCHWVQDCIITWVYPINDGIYAF